MSLILKLIIYFITDTVSWGSIDWAYDKLNIEIVSLSSRRLTKERLMTENLMTEELESYSSFQLLYN